MKKRKTAVKTRKTDRPFIVSVEGRESHSFWAGRQWWSVQLAANGEIVYQTEMHTSKEKRDSTATEAAKQLGVKYDDAGELF